MKQNIFFIGLIVLGFLAGCSDDNESGPTLKEQYVQNYVAIVRANYADALAKTEELQASIKTFVSTPTKANFDAAKQAWLDAREPYGQTEVYRFYDGPIDGDDGEPEGYLNAWPLDEALIDYVSAGTGGQDGSVPQNIVSNSTDFPTINEETLRGATGAHNNESNVALGYHAIEFLLWGQDLDQPSALTSGNRLYTDYTTADNADRRGQYLSVAADILVKDLKSVVDQWENDGAYRDTFLALSADEAITMILTGAAKLSKGELAGERMTVAVKNQSQEDEHSCFSDNTHRDIYLNAVGINNVLYGKYSNKVSGVSIFDLLQEADAAQVAALKAKATEVMTKVQVISDAKFFDNQIIGESIDNNAKPVMSAVTSLEDQGDLVSAANKAITGNTITGDLED